VSADGGGLRLTSFRVSGVELLGDPLAWVRNLAPACDVCNERSVVVLDVVAVTTDGTRAPIGSRALCERCAGEVLAELARPVTDRPPAT
jgi:hypothetical protein